MFNGAKGSIVEEALDSDIRLGDDVETNSDDGDRRVVVPVVKLHPMYSEVFWDEVPGIDDRLPDDVWFWKMPSGGCFDKVDNSRLAFTVGNAEFWELDVGGVVDNVGVLSAAEGVLWTAVDEFMSEVSPDVD